MTIPTKTLSTQSSVTRKTRFSQLEVDPSIFASTQKPMLELYSDDLEGNSSSSCSFIAFFFFILVPTDSIPSTLGADLKITSSSTFRKVEIQGGMSEKSNSSRDLPNDLRLTLGKNRTRQSNNDDQHQTSDITEPNTEQQSMLNMNENKQQR